MVHVLRSAYHSQFSFLLSLLWLFLLDYSKFGTYIRSFGDRVAVTAYLRGRGAVTAYLRGRVSVTAYLKGRVSVTA